jgi:DNA-binding transcriptional ArsR family regulator
VDKTLLADAATMRVLAHPLRMRILGSLRVDGPATSALLARRLGTDSGQTSHHLRLLARHEYVAEAPELGRGAHGRERWWKAVHEETRYAAGEPGTAEAFKAFERTARSIWDDAIEAYHADVARRRWSPAWQRTAGSCDFVVRTTPERLAELQAEIERLVRSYDTEGERALVVLHTYPLR